MRRLCQLGYPIWNLLVCPKEVLLFGGKRNIGGDQYLGYASIGNAMVGLVLASAEDRLFMHGGSQKVGLAEETRSVKIGESSIQIFSLSK